MRRYLLLLCAALLLAGCNLPSAPGRAPTPTPSLTPSAAAIPTQSPTARPSATPEPTETATLELPTPTEPPVVYTPASDAIATARFATEEAQLGFVSSPVPTPTVQKELDCKLMWQSHSKGASVAPGEKFGSGWDVMNTGTATWDSQNVSLVYLGGARMHGDESPTLDTSVGPEEEIILSVRMRAPDRQGRYTSYWGLRQGDIYFCRLSVTVYVDPSLAE